MTTFEIIMIILAVLAVLLIGMLIKRITYVGHILLETIGDIASNNAERISATNGHLFDISQQLDNIEDNILDDLRDIRIADKCISDLAINVKGNYNTLEQQQESIGYIKARVNHILSLIHPAEEVVKPDVPTALDGLSNVPKDNANKSTNYNGYDPTIVVRGSETTNKED